MPEMDERRERMVSLVLLLLFLLIAGGTGLFVLRELHVSDAEAPAADVAPEPEPPFAPAPPAAQEPASRPSKLTPPRLTNLAQLRASILKFYPEAERRSGRQANVLLSLVVEADGSVSRAEIKTSAGAAFDEAAKKVALAMKFVPARKGEESLAVQIDESVDFTLDR